AALGGRPQACARRRGRAADRGGDRGARAGRARRGHAQAGADAARADPRRRVVAWDARLPALPSGGAGAVRETIAGVLLFAGVGLELAAALGVVAMRGVLQRIHYTGLAMLGSVPI